MASFLWNASSARRERLGGLELGVEVVEEEGLDDAEDVLLAGVVGAEVAALLGVHDALEHGAEDGRADLAPVDEGGGEEGVAHLAGEAGGADGIGEEAAVDVGEALEVGVEDRLALVFGGVEDLENLDQEGAGVGAVVAGAVAEEVGEGVALEDAGVVGEEAEDDAGQEQFEIAPGVAVGLQLVMEGGHALGGEAVDGFFFVGDVSVSSMRKPKRRTLRGRFSSGKVTTAFVSRLRSWKVAKSETTMAWGRS